MLPTRLFESTMNQLSVLKLICILLSRVDVSKTSIVHLFKIDKKKEVLSIPSENEIGL